MSLFERVLLALVLLFWAGIGAAVLTIITFATYLAIIFPHEQNNDMAGLGVPLFAFLTVPAGLVLGPLTGLYRGGYQSRRQAGTLAWSGVACCLAVASVSLAFVQNWVIPASLWSVLAWSLYAVVVGTRGLSRPI